VSATEFARQLTLLEHDIYRSINPWEFLKQRWAKNKDQAPNILNMIQFSNQLSNWLVGEVVKEVELRQRTLVLKHVIDVAEKCRELNNFNAVMELLACLDSSPVYRLRQSWAGLSRSTLKTYESLKDLMSPNSGSKNLRSALRTVDPPAVPYLGVFLTDLTFIEEGNTDVLHNTELINFDKRRKIASVIQEIRQRQHIPYNLCPVPSIQDLILNSTPLTEQVAYKLSVQNEQKIKSQAAIKAEKEALKAAAVNKKRLGITGEGVS
jgi:son of sevenless